MIGHTRRRDPYRILSYVVVVLFLIWVLAPIVTVALNSLKVPADIFTRLPRLLFSPTLQHYERVLGDLDFLGNVRTSVVVALASTALSLCLGLPAAYALARLPLRGREGWAGLILFTRMAPAVALVVPVFVLFNQLSLLGTVQAIILAHTTFTLPLVIWMMRSFFEELPAELEEAAKVDGASTFGAFRRVALPLAMNGVVAAAVLCVLFSWNEFLFALILSGPATKTVPIGVASFIGTVSVDWGGSSAAAVIAMIPVFILGLGVQRFLVRGLTLGAVKG
jgi:multiple sugar transport system permease protein